MTERESKEFYDDLRRKLEGYGSLPPESVWAGIRFNCDRFLPATLRTNVQINVARPTVTTATTRAFLSFTTLNSVLAVGLSSTSGVFSADQVPLGYSVTAVVVHQEGSQLYFGKQTATIATNQQFTPALRAVTEAELLAEVNAL